MITFFFGCIGYRFVWIYSGMKITLINSFKQVEMKKKEALFFLPVVDKSDRFSAEFRKLDLLDHLGRFKADEWRYP